MTYRFLHAADLHLDSPFKGLAQTDAELAAGLRDASLQALDNLVDCAIRSRCHFVVLCGDIYDGLKRGARAQLRLRDAAARLHEAGIRLFLLHGNHDPLDEGYAAVHKWPETTHFFRADRPEAIEFDTPAGRVTITGQSYPAKHVHQNLASHYPPPERDGLHVALLHTQVVAGAEPTNPYSPCRVTDLIGTRFHYWALGHVHTREILRNADPLVAYPGNTQGRGFGETGPKGALLVQGRPDRLTTEFVPLAPYVFERVVVDVSGRVDLDEVAGDLIAAIPENADARQLLRAELHGRSPVYASLRSADAIDDLIATLHHRSPDGVTWLDVRTHVAPDLDLDALAEVPTLPGALVATARSRDVADIRDVLGKNKLLGRWLAKQRDADLQALANRALFRAVGAVHDGSEA